MVADQESGINPFLALFVVALAVVGYSAITMDRSSPKKFAYRKTRKRA